MKTFIKVLPVFQGDAFLLFFNNREACIMIDSGTRRGYSKGVLKNELKRLKSVDLLVLTHADEDHIGGILKYYEDKERIPKLFKNVWFNSGSVISKELGLAEGEDIDLYESSNLAISIKQGRTLEQELKKEEILFRRAIKAQDTYHLYFAEINVLSPDIGDLRNLLTKWEVESEKQLEVTSINDFDKRIGELSKLRFVEKGTLANKASIAVFIETDSARMLFLGDAFPTVVEKNIRKFGYNEYRKLKLDIVKISHHGSNAATSPDLLKIIDCTRFIISTNGGNNLPSKECLSRIITHRKDKITLYFNYENEVTGGIFSGDEMKEHNFEVIYLNPGNNFTISVGE